MTPPPDLRARGVDVYRDGTHAPTFRVERRNKHGVEYIALPAATHARLLAVVEAARLALFVNDFFEARVPTSEFWQRLTAEAYVEPAGGPREWVADKLRAALAALEAAK